MLPQMSMQLREYEMALAHTPVLLDELLDLLRPARGEVAIDCTFGAGGHAEAVAAMLGVKSDNFRGVIKGSLSAREHRSETITFVYDRADKLIKYWREE